MFIIIIIVLSGCVTSTQTNREYNNRKPIIQTYQDPYFKADNYKTFSVFPSSQFFNETEIDGILEKQMLFLLRINFEMLGYKFVEINKSPDFLVTIDGSSQYKENYIPPQSITLPQYIPGKTIITHERSRGTFNINEFSTSNYGWGNWQGSSTTTTRTPGQWTTKTYTKSGYYSGAYYPKIIINVFDGKTFENIWMGVGVAVSDNPDLRISSQIVLLTLSYKFPQSKYKFNNYPLGSGRLGFGYRIYTFDGNNYYPIINTVSQGTPAYKAGLEPGDIIISINNIDTVNKPISEIDPLCTGEAGDKIKLLVLRARNNNQFEVEMTFAQK